MRYLLTYLIFSLLTLIGLASEKLLELVTGIKTLDLFSYVIGDFIGLLLIAVSFPHITKWGMSVGTVYFYFLFLSLLYRTECWRILTEKSASANNVLSNSAARPDTGFFILPLLLIVLFLSVLSCYISMQFYEKREF